MSEVTFTCQACGKCVTLPAERRGHVEICPHCDHYVDVPEGPPKVMPVESENTASAACGSEQVEGLKKPDAESRSNAQLWFEVIAVLCLSYLPYQISSLIGFFHGYARDSFALEELWQIVQACQTTIPLLLILALTRESWSRFGIVRPWWFVDVLAGCLICLTAFAARRLLLLMLPPTLWQVSVPLHETVRPGTAGECVLLVISLAVGAFSEELVMRGYLIPRFERLLGSTGKAILLTSLLFAGYHIYQGLVPVLGHFAVGLVYAVAFCILRRLWPLWAAHLLGNLFCCLPG
ncbi:MAG: CPBP family intramembrane metalloprotease [Pirellulales bacterium]|nr:CPBP family intramembrane metalloprotease [Pirellulales bacterium]